MLSFSQVDASLLWICPVRKSDMNSYQVLEVNSQDWESETSAFSKPAPIPTIVSKGRQQVQQTVKDLKEIFRWYLSEIIMLAVIYVCMVTGVVCTLLVSLLMFACVSFSLEMELLLRPPTTAISVLKFCSCRSFYRARIIDKERNSLQRTHSCY